MISYIAVLVSIHKLYEIFIHKKTGAQTDESTENALNAATAQTQWRDLAEWLKIAKRGLADSCWLALPVWTQSKCSHP